MKGMFSLLVSLFCITAGVFATSVEQIHVSYESSPSKMVVSFAAFTSETSAEILFGTSASNLTQTVSVKGYKYTMSSYTSPMLFNGTLSNLSVGNKIYYYSVGSKSLGYSAVSSFKTHPGVGVNDVTFHVCGDLGQTSNTETTVAELVSFEDALATPSGGIVSMGDLSYANGDQPLWDSFGNMIQVASGHIPMMTTLGNHEWFDSKNHDFTAYLARYSNPTVNGQRELYYSYDSGLVHWVMIAGKI